VRYDTPAAFRQALEDRLKLESRTNNVSLDRLRTMVVFDRFLARLIAVAPGRWILKGGLALDYRLGYRARTTKDIDLGRQDTEEGAANDLRAAQAFDAQDYFVFVVTRTDRLDDADDVDGAVRFHVDAELAGRRFDSVTLDVGFGDPELFAPTMLTPPPLLAFAGIETPDIPVLPVEQHVAEKVHAYTRRYKRGASTRVKDLVDLLLFLENETVAATRLRQSLEATFASRASHDLPSAFPLPPPGWRTPYSRLAMEVRVDPDVDSAHQRVAAFLDPVLRSEVLTGSWDNQSQVWTLDPG